LARAREVAHSAHAAKRLAAFLGVHISQTAIMAYFGEERFFAAREQPAL
jgi:hypothetical protein